MARATKGAVVRVRTVRSKEDRRRPSVFMRLKTDESFMGYALFEPDPELEDNPGYFEYYDHFDKQGNTYVPCAGEDCPFCAANDNPSTRALTTWYFPEASDKKDQIKLFTMNYMTIEDITDESEEEGGIIGKKIRIRRLDDRGNYKLKTMTDKPLTKKQQADLLVRLESEILQGKGMEGLVLSQLKRQMERLKAIDMLDEDEDEEDEETPKPARKGRAAVAEDEEDEEDEAEDEEEEDEEEDEETDEAEAEAEEDEEEEDENEPDEDEEEAEVEDADEIKGALYEVIRIQRQDEIFDLRDAEGTKVKMWLGDGIDVDYDSIVKGAEVVIDAAKDEEDDWILTSITLPKPKRGRPRAKA